jgi:hypothetical protein
MDRRRYDSAMFWLPFGTAAAVIGLALMTIGATRLPAGANLFDSTWFDSGVTVLVIGVVLLLWALVLFLGRRRGAVVTAAEEGAPADPMKAAEVEAVRGYYAEREKLMRLYEKQQEKQQGEKTDRP